MVTCPNCAALIVLPDVFTGSFIMCDTCLHEWAYTQPPDARLNDIRPHNPDLADTLARWLDDARCIDRDIDEPLLVDEIDRLIDRIQHEMVTGERA
jgi:hypothetical protein